jgi:prepilin-type N-terminal cleavage/methylation domain-containing protein
MTRCTRGFTLLEIIVAMGVFTILGFGATALLVTGLSSWRMAEGRRDAAERAELIFETLNGDVACLYTDAARAPTRAILYSDYEKEGRQRLIVARTVPPPGADPRLASAGRTMAARETIDGSGDLDGLKRNVLRSPGDLLSAVYFLSSDEKLYRAAVTPEKTHGEILAPWGEKGAQLVAEGVMHLEYNFWSPKTTAWRGGENTIGPSYFWDSTRGLGSEQATAEEAARRFVFNRSGSLEDPRDDLFARLIEVKVVLSMPHRGGSAYLTEDLSAVATRVSVSGAADYPAEEGEHFVKIDQEWLSYERISADGMAFEGVVRGRRESQPGTHAAGAVVRHGVTFRMVVRPPPALEPWEVRR